MKQRHNGLDGGGRTLSPTPGNPGGKLATSFSMDCIGYGPGARFCVYHGHRSETRTTSLPTTRLCSMSSWASRISPERRRARAHSSLFPTLSCQDTIAGRRRADPRARLRMRCAADASSITPTHSMPSTRGDVTPSASPGRVWSSERLRPNAFTAMWTQPGGGSGIGSSVNCRFSTNPDSRRTIARISLFIVIRRPLQDASVIDRMRHA